jgi:MFS family permease
MGGVNTNRNYATTMGFGFFDESRDQVNVTHPLLQGGIVSLLSVRHRVSSDSAQQVAVYYLPGALIGAFVGGWLGDKYGRVKTIAIGSAWTIFGAVMQTAAQNSDWMFCARVLNGIGTGILCAITPVWATEISSHMSRGAFVAIEFTLNIFGVVVAYWLE